MCVYCKTQATRDQSLNPHVKHEQHDTKALKAHVKHKPNETKAFTPFVKHEQHTHTHTSRL